MGNHDSYSDHLRPAGDDLRRHHVSAAVFHMRIRREVIAINQKMSRIEELLAQLSAKQHPASAPQLKSDDRSRLIKVCENCGRKNSLQDAKCMGCGEFFQ